MTDRTKPPPGWRCYKCDDGVWQCHPSSVGKFPDISVSSGRKLEPLIEEAWRKMDAIAAPYIAAELRRLADEAKAGAGWMDGYLGSEDPEWFAHRLRTRAAEIDPPG